MMHRNFSYASIFLGDYKMAFINKNDFSIVSYVSDCILSKNYFECDDLIAPAISLLNKKGYKTEFCCSGHPYSVIDSMAASAYPSEKDIENIGIISIVPSENTKDIPDWVDKKEYSYYITFYNSYPDCGFYVTFKEDYEFNNLPKGAYIHEEGGIYWNIDEPSTNDFNMVTRIYEFNKAFYEWVEKLPSLI